MDPILLALMKRLQQARKTDPSISDADAEDFLRQESGGKYGFKDTAPLTDVSARNMLRSGTQGALFNWADKLLAKVPPQLGGGPDEAAQMADRQQIFETAHPNWSALAKGAGIGAGALIPGGAEVDALKAFPLVKAALIGGAGAGVAAAGEAPPGAPMSDRARNALQAIPGGTLFGMVLPAALKTLTAFSPEARANARLTHEVNESGPQTAALDRLFPAKASASPAGLDAVQGSLNDAVAAGKGDQVMLGDLSTRLRKLTDYAANASPDVHSTLGDATFARQGGQPERLIHDFQDVTGAAPDATSRLSSLQADRQAWANGPFGYGGIRDETPTVPNVVFPKKVDPKIAAAITDIETRSAALPGGMSPASQAAIDALRAQQGRPTDPLAQMMAQPKVRGGLAAAQTEGMIGAMPEPSDLATFDKMLSFKQRLDDMIETAFSPLHPRGNLGNRLKEVRDAVNQHMIDYVPGYKQVSTEYAARMGQERALMAGEQAFASDNGRKISAEFHDLSGADKQEYRYGLASGFIKQLENARTNQATAAKLLQMSKTMETKMRLVFDSPEQFHQYMARVNVERNMGQQVGSTGGSATKARFSNEEFDPAEAAISMGTHHSLGYGARTAAARWGRGFMARGTAGALQPSLMAQGSAEIQPILDAIRSGARRPLAQSAALSQGLPFLMGRGAELIQHRLLNPE